MAKYFVIIFILFFTIHASFASYVLIPMDLKQSNHLKAYGIAYWIIDQKIDVYWLLNYRGGSFVFVNTKVFEKECITLSLIHI